MLVSGMTKPAGVDAKLQPLRWSARDRAQRSFALLEASSRLALLEKAGAKRCEAVFVSNGGGGIAAGVAKVCQRQPVDACRFPVDDRADARAVTENIGHRQVVVSGDE